MQAVHHAFLRHSWNRVDLFAVISFWITFGLAMGGQEATSNHHIYIFRALSVLRCARLLTATSGTTTILHSLKMSGFILLSVSFFTGFAMLLFGIVASKASKDPIEGTVFGSAISTADQGTTVLCHNCAEATSALLVKSSVTFSSMAVLPAQHPKASSVREVKSASSSPPIPRPTRSPSTTSSLSLLEVVIVISSNNWSQTMYDMIDADYYASCIYFIIGIIILNFWLANLFVAVITNTSLPSQLAPSAVLSPIKNCKTSPSKMKSSSEDGKTQKSRCRLQASVGLHRVSLDPRHHFRPGHPGVPRHLPRTTGAREASHDRALLYACLRL